MCDGTPCPCNLIEPTPAELAARERARQARLAALSTTGRYALRTAGGLSGLTVLLAVIVALTGSAVVALLGPLAVLAVLVAVGVGATCLAVPAVHAVRRRHRHAIERARRP